MHVPLIQSWQCCIFMVSLKRQVVRVFEQPASFSTEHNTHHEKVAFHRIRLLCSYHAGGGCESWTGDKATASASKFVARRRGTTSARARRAERVTSLPQGAVLLSSWMEAQVTASASSNGA
eukprot:6199616-Pleurochrysis_carterae.AAC.2